MAVELASVSLHIPTQAAGTDDQWYVAWPHKGTWMIDYIAFAPATAVATSGSVGLTSTIAVNDSAASTTWTTVATHDTTIATGVAFVLGTTVAPTVTPAKIAQGYTIRVAKTHASTGSILDGTYTIQARKVN